MSLALLQSALLLPVELTINQLLALDTASHAQLAALASNTLAIELQQPAFTLFVSVHADRLRLSPRHEGTVTATLIGSPTALAGLLLRRQPLTTLQGTGVELHGSTGFVLALRKLLLQLHFDWEFQLSRLIGDVPTQLTADSVRTASDYVQRTAQRVRDDVSDFLLEEGRLVPTAAELEAFTGDVQTLALQIDRATARLSLLER